MRYCANCSRVITGPWPGTRRSNFTFAKRASVACHTFGFAVSKNGTDSVTRSPATSVPVFLSRIHRSPAFVSYGRARVVLYDGREDSPTHGVVNEFRFGTIRPAMIHIPPRVWHGVQNVGDEVAILVNIVDRAYDYEDPDHWRVPADSPEIPFRF